jgi:hypothetical protein
MIGQDLRGNWVVQDQKRMAGGLFATRDAALRYVRSESGCRPPAVVMVSGNLELDISRSGSAPASRQTAREIQHFPPHRLTMMATV